MSSLSTTILLIHTAATLFMLGLIWFVQVVHYPLFGRVGREEFLRYEQAHQRLTTWVVAPPMLLELVTAILLVAMDFTSINPALRWAGLALVVLIWLSTIFVQIPQHAALAKSWDEDVHHKLVRGNWLRTVAWSVRSALSLLMIAEFIGNTSP